MRRPSDRPVRWLRGQYMGDGVISAIRMPTKTTPSAQFGSGWRSSGASELRSAWSWSAISSGPGGPGARHRWRDPQPCGTPAGHRRAEHSVIAEVKAVRQFVRASGPPDGPQGYRGGVRAWGLLRSNEQRANERSCRQSRMRRGLKLISSVRSPLRARSRQSPWTNIAGNASTAAGHPSHDVWMDSSATVAGSDDVCGPDQRC
jgi:hypothetical protein